MTSVLSCLVATIALAADPGLKGLPFGIPPAPDDPVISRIAPPQCLLYVNWAGTAAPRPGSGSETEKLLAEPEVQEFFSGLGKVFDACLRNQDGEPKAPAASRPEDHPAPATIGLSMPSTYLPGSMSNLSAQPAVNNAAVASSPAPIEAKPAFNVSAEDYGDSLTTLLTHPTAIFLTDVKVAPPKPVEKKAHPQKPGDKQAAVKEPATSDSPDVEIQAGMVVSLGPDAARLHAKFNNYLRQAKKVGADSAFERIKIDGKTWYRSKPTQPGDMNVVTFGFRGKYLVVGVGQGAVEGILARWNRPAPAWLTTALEQTQVPRRTGIIYLNLKSLRDKLLPLAPSQTGAVAVLKLLGLDNVQSLISTTGLEDYGMINRVLLALDGKPRGLLDMVADRPLAAKDLEPIPSDALLAMATRVDLRRTFEVLMAAYEAAGAAGDADARKTLAEMKKEYGGEVRRFLSSLGDTWCLYNSPTEGEIAFLGWTVVAPVRDRAALLDSWQKLCAAQDKKEAAKAAAKDKNGGDSKASDNTQTAEFCKCRFAGHEIYYVAGLPLAPAFYVSDHELVMTLNMPAMKAYLARKNHRSLAALPGVALALNDPNRPVALGYCDTPRLFDFVYPMFSLYATVGATALHQAKIDLDPTFWPSAPAIRAHLRPDITTVQRTPHGLQLTCRYCLPTGGANAPLCLIGLGVLGSSFAEGNLFSQVLPSPGSCTNAVPLILQSDAPAGKPTEQIYGSYSSAPGSGTNSPASRYGTSPVPQLTAAPVPASSAASSYSSCTPCYNAAATAGAAPSNGGYAPPFIPGAGSNASGNSGYASPYSAALAGSASSGYYGSIGIPSYSATPAASATSSYSGYASPYSTAPAAQYSARPASSSMPATASPYGSAAPNPYGSSASPGYGCAPATSYPSIPAGPRAGAPAASANPYGNPYGLYGSAPGASASPYGSASGTSYPGTSANPYSSTASTPAYPYSLPAATPSNAGVATIPDVVAMIRAGVDESLVVNHIHLHGLAAPLRASDVINLHQQGVSLHVIAAMQGEHVAGASATPAAGSKAAADRYAMLSTPAVSSYKAASPPPTGPQYQIGIKLIQTTPDGKEQVLSQPQLITLEGQPACLGVGQDISSPQAIKLDEPLWSGIHVRVNILRKDGLLFLDATENKSEPSRADAEGVHIATQSVRVVERITLGKKIVVHLPQAKDVRWELLVQEPQKTPIGNMPSATPASAPQRSRVQ